MEARAAENKSRKQLGSTSKTLVGDEFHKDCKQLETYVIQPFNAASGEFDQYKMMQKKFLMTKNCGTWVLI